MPDELSAPVTPMLATPTEILFARGTLMDLYIGKPTFQKKLKSDDILVENIDPDAIYLGHKNLISKQALANLVTVEGRARRALAVRSLEFPLSGARFVVYQALPDVLDELSSLKIEWDDEVEALIARYPNLMTEQLEVLDAQCEALMRAEVAKLAGVEREAKQTTLNQWLINQRNHNRSLYPPLEMLRNMFHFEWRMFKISPLEGTEEMSTLDQTALASAQRQLKEDLQHWVRAAAMEMHKTLGETAANALRLLNENEKLNPRNLKPLFDAFETFKAIDFTGASSFQQVVDQMKSTFGLRDAAGDLDYQRIADHINLTPDMGSFKKLLTKVSELAIDDVAKEAGLSALTSVGEIARMIEL